MDVYMCVGGRVVVAYLLACVLVWGANLLP